MARLLTAGFETGTIMEMNGPSNTAIAAPEVSTTARTGTYSLKLGAYGSGLTGAYKGHVFGDDLTELWFRFAFQYDANVAGDFPLLKFYDDLGAIQIILAYDISTQSLQWQNGAGTMIAAGHLTLQPSTWYMIEGHLTIGGSGVATCKVNAVTDASFSGDTDYTNAGNVRALRFTGPPISGGFMCYCYIDDIGVNDGTDSFQNSYPGLGGIFFLKANGDGVTTDWTTSEISDHYALVDEVPANTTDWVQGENAGDLELFDIENTPTYVVAINVVQPVFQAAVAVSGSNELQDVVYDGASEYPGSTTHTIISIHPTYVLYRGETYYEQPDGVSGAFDEDALDALQVGFQIPV